MEEKDYRSVLCYMEDNTINMYSRFLFAVDDTTNQMYMSHVMLGDQGPWKPYKTVAKKPGTNQEERFEKPKRPKESRKPE